MSFRRLYCFTRVHHGGAGPIAIFSSGDLVKQFECAMLCSGGQPYNAAAMAKISWWRMSAALHTANCSSSFAPGPVAMTKGNLLAVPDGTQGIRVSTQRVFDLPKMP